MNSVVSKIFKDSSSPDWELILPQSEKLEAEAKNAQHASASVLQSQVSVCPWELNESALSPTEGVRESPFYAFRFRILSNQRFVAGRLVQKRSIQSCSCRL
jgi:hypothetical protein